MSENRGSIIYLLRTGKAGNKFPLRLSYLTLSSSKSVVGR
jgi:hypothetical protein